LFGAELSFANQNVEQYGLEEESNKISLAFRKKLTLLIAHYVIDKFCSKKEAPSIDEIKRELNLPYRLVSHIVEELINAKIFAKISEEEYKVIRFQPNVDPAILTIHYVLNAIEELGANEIAFMLQEKGLTKGVGGEVPRLHDIGKNLKMYTALSAAIHSDLVASAHDCSDGGLAVSLAEMCIGGRHGASVNISKISETTLFARLYGESLARIVVAIKPESTEAFENSMSGNHFTKIGESTNNNYLEIKSASKKILKLNLDQMVEAWQSTFKGEDF
jgi:hypothetical protein